MLNWRLLPFVRLILPFSLGIVLASCGWIFSTPQYFAIAIGFLISTLSAVLWRKSYPLRWLSGIPLSIALLFLGYWSLFLQAEQEMQHHFREKLNEKAPIWIAGIVQEATEKAPHWRLTLKVIYAGADSTNFKAVEGQLLVYARKDSLSSPNFRYGDYILTRATPHAIESSKNPAAFDFQHYWHLKNIHFQAFMNVEQIKILAQDASDNPLWAQAQKAQTYFVSVLKKYLPQENEWAVASALLLGSRDAVPEDIKNAYIETGAIHILAISGMHIVLIFNRLEWLLSLYKNGRIRWRVGKAAILIVFIWLFALLTGFTPSVVRAALMSSLLIVGKAANRSSNPFNLLVASAFLLLLYDPFWLFDVGFQLSYAAVGGIYLYNQIFDKPLIFNHKIANWVAQNLLIGFAAQLAVTPLALYYFHQIPTYFWLSGLLVGVVSEYALLVGVVLLLVNGFPFLPALLGQVLNFLIWLMNQIIFQIQKLPLSMIDAWGMTDAEIYLLTLMLAGFIIAVWQRRLRLLIYPLSIFLILTLFSAFLTHKNQIKGHLVVYATTRLSLVEILCEGKCYRLEGKNDNVENFFLDKNAIEKKQKYATENHHKVLKINELLTFHLDEYVKNNFFLYRNKYIRLPVTKVYVLDKLPDKPLNLFIDYLIVRHNPKITMESLVSSVRFKQVIFDGSNSRKQVEKWRQECQKNNISYHDVNTQGAWVHYF